MSGCQRLLQRLGRPADAHIEAAKPGQAKTATARQDPPPRSVAMRILRHSKIEVTMEVYTQVPDDSTRDALRRLGEQLDG